jgi:hypothetical protein
MRTRLSGLLLRLKYIGSRNGRICLLLRIVELLLPLLLMPLLLLMLMPLLLHLLLLLLLLLLLRLQLRPFAPDGSYPEPVRSKAIGII